MLLCRESAYGPFTARPHERRAQHLAIDADLLVDATVEEDAPVLDSRLCDVDPVPLSQREPGSVEPLDLVRVLGFCWCHLGQVFRARQDVSNRLALEAA